MAPNELARLEEPTCTYPAPQLGRLAWEELVSVMGSNGFMVTLGFRVYLDATRAIAVANHFLLRINRRLYGKRFPRHSKFLRGAVILEHKYHSTRASNSPHFHFVVSPSSLATPDVSEEELREIIENEAGRLRYPTYVYDRPFGEVISGSAFINITKIGDADNLANYLTKDCYRFGPAGHALNIGFLTVDGIEGIPSISRFND